MKNAFIWIFVATLPLAAQNHTCPFRAAGADTARSSRWSRNLRARPPRFSPTHRYMIPEAQRQAVIDLA